MKNLSQNWKLMGVTHLGTLVCMRVNKMKEQNDICHRLVVAIGVAILLRRVKLPICNIS